MDSQLIDLLRKAPASGIPSDEACTALAVDREALERLVASLRESGRLVRFGEGGRVQFHETDEPLSPDRLRSRPPGTVGSPLLLLPEIDSTNAEALRRVAEGSATHGLTLVAEAQTAGRGREENVWFSPPGAGLWLSVVLSLKLPGDRVPLITQVTGVQVARALERALEVSPRVKWPNDLHLEGRKVAGILTEARSMEGEPTFAAVGIGINVNPRNSDFPPPLQSTATSLRIHTGAPLDRAPLLDAVLDALQEGCEALATGDLTDLEKALRSRSAVLGKSVRVREGDEFFTGRVVEQSLAEGLVLETDAGDRRRFRGEYIHSLDLL
ncbi:MAG: biotin--[acetyl-CoA-carboxylase] ligase [Planctomycetota bacterium]|jgi:BirA family biotin operon repressor/biotin-[acetyl-CoA-carboxylase] ligase